MKTICKRVLVCVLAVLLLITATACSPSFKEPSAYLELPDHFNAGTDFPMRFFSSFDYPMVPDANGYYIFNASFLFYFDRESGISAPVCNRPECFHNGTTCNAYFSRGMNDLLQFYEGKLYVTVTERDENQNPSCWLYEVNPEDCTRSRICQMPYLAEESVRFFMHRGYLYIVSYEVAAYEGNSQELKPAFVVAERIALNELSEKSLTPELIFKHESYSFGMPYIFGNHLLVQYQQQGAIGLDFIWTDIDLNTLETETIAFPDLPNSAYIAFEREYEDKLIATYVDYNDYLKNDCTTRYYTYDLQAGTFEPFATLPDRGEGVYDLYAWDGENHCAFYLDKMHVAADKVSTQEFRVLDENFETKKQIPTDWDVYGFLPSDSDYTFFTIVEDNLVHLYAIDKRGEELKIVKVFE